MPPKISITKEMLIQGAFEFIRKNGIARLSTRNLAAFVGCSTQPIYRAFRNMDELELAASERAASFVKEFLFSAPIEGELLHHIPRMQVRLMKEEPHIYHLIFLTGHLDFSKANEMLNDLIRHTAVREHPYLQKIEPDRIMNIIRQTWVYTHGLFAIIGFQFIDPAEQLIMQAVKDMVAKLVVWEIHKSRIERREEYGDWPVYAHAFEPEMDLGVDIRDALIRHLLMHGR